MSAQQPLIIADDGPSSDSFLVELAAELSTSAGLFAGQCNFPIASGSQDLEVARTRLVEATLRASQKIFDDGLSAEQSSLPFISVLAAHARDQRPATRSQASRKRKNEGLPQLQHTPLNQLYLGSPEEGIVLDEEAIWKQMKLRHEGVMGWVKEALDEDDFEEPDEDLMASRRKQSLGLPADADSDDSGEDEEGQIDFDNIDLDDFDSPEDDDDDGGTLSSDEDEDENGSSGLSETCREDTEGASYVTRLNDHDGSTEESEDEDEDKTTTLASASRQPAPKSKGKSKAVDDQDGEMSLDHLESRPQSNKKPTSHRKSKLDDAFFSFNDFEDEAEQGELQMRRQLRKWAGHAGEPEDEESDEDEEDVDLFANLGTGVIPGGSDGEDEEEEEEEEEEEGGMDLSNVADLRYADFFDPPARLPPKKNNTRAPQQKPHKTTPHKIKSSTPTATPNAKSPRVMFSEKVIVKEIPAKNKGVRVADIKGPGDDDDDEDGDEGAIYLTDSESEEDGDENEDDISSDADSQGSGETDGASSQTDSNASGDAEQRTMGRFSGDLFDDGFSQDDSDRGSSGSKDDQAVLSRHAKKLKVLSKQIAELEAENVAKKDWTLKGEAAARDRPQNSLLEEDLEFEHIQKVAPAVTEEKTLGLEALIKQRILEGQFDDVIRRRPIDPKAFLPSRLLELQDTQSSKSLAEIYEDEYRSSKTKAETGVAAVDPKDEKLNKEHEELKALFEDLCGKLDALSNAHFTPKQPKATIKTINNLPSIALESALPTATGASTLLAPEELYAANPKSVQRDHSELSHVQKQAERRQRKKDKKAEKKKIETVTGKPVEAKGVEKMSTKEQKENSLKQLAKVQGVTIIGKRPLGVDEGPKKTRKLESGAVYKL